MRLLFIADGRSSTALSWLQYWIGNGHETHLISTFPCDPPQGVSSFHILPIAFAGMARPVPTGEANSSRPGWVKRFRGGLRTFRYILGPLSLPIYYGRYRAILDEIRPELIHALRIPYEGMLASSVKSTIPLVVSTWGNDLTLHARGSLFMRLLTRRTLRRSAGLISDTRRDSHLAVEWGFPADRPVLVVPGAGGIDLVEVAAASPSEPLPEPMPDRPLIVNPRGQRPGSLRQDVFFQSIPLVHERIPAAFFVCPSLAGDLLATRWVETLGLGGGVKLWPHLSRSQILALYKRSEIFVSPSLHDGTPNSLLEAMACGCFPVVGDIESLREWVSDGVNGLLVDASSPRALADAIVRALEDPGLRQAAKTKNALIIAERADYRQCMAMTGAFYRNLITR